TVASPMLVAVKGLGPVSFSGSTPVSGSAKRSSTELDDSSDGKGSAYAAGATRATRVEPTKAVPRTGNEGRCRVPEGCVAAVVGIGRSHSSRGMPGLWGPRPEGPWNLRRA